MGITSGITSNDSLFSPPSSPTIASSVINTASAEFVTSPVNPAVLLEQVAVVKTPTPPATPEDEGVGTTAYLQSIMGQIDKAVDSNPLNKYYQTAYHFRLFTIGDTDLLTATDAKSLSELASALSKIPQVTIAESGVTGFNIRGVEMITKPSGNYLARMDNAATGEITITEPNGISFLDGLLSASAALGTKNFAKAPYYLELTFRGYNEDGSKADLTIDPKIGRWIWGIALSDIDVAMDERGTVYTIKYKLNNYPHHDVNIDVTVFPQAIQVSGKTLGDVYKDLVDKVNASMKAAYDVPIVVIDGIITNQIDRFFSHPPSVAGKNPATFCMTPYDVNHNPDRSLNDKGEYTVTMPRGTTLQQFILDCVLHTEEGQALIKDEPVRTREDQTATQVNSTDIRQSIAFSVEPVIKINEYDPNTQNYIKHITFYLTPYYTQKGIQNNEQQIAASTQAGQQKKVTSFIENGFLKRKYEYIYTGLNTEIIDFSLAFTAKFDAIKAAYKGAQMRYDMVTQPARQTKSTPNTGNSAETTQDAARQPVKTSPAPGSGAGTTSTSGSGPLTSTGRAAVPQASTPNAQASTPAGPQTTEQEFVPDFTGNLYVEDLIRRDLPTGNPVVSFQQMGDRAYHESGQQGFVGQNTIDQSMAGAIMAQIYDRTVTGSYSQLRKMTIRGDPFWLGQSNIQRQIHLMQGNLSVRDATLPNYAAGNQMILVNFRYPIQMGDDFKPVLRDSVIFNGLYYVSTVTHKFVEGSFTQELAGNIDPLGQSGKMKTATNNNNNGGPASSPQQSQPTTTSTQTVTPPAPPAPPLQLDVAGVSFS